MSEIKAQEVEKIANLARLGISEEEKIHYAQDLSNIFGLVDQLNQNKDLDGITPLFHPEDNHLRIRSDAVTETNQRQLFQSIAPLVQAGLYLVPKVVE